MFPVAHNVKGHVLRQRSLEARSGLAPSCWLSPARPRARGHSPSSEQAPLLPLHIPLQGSEILRVTLLLSRNLPARHRLAFLPRPRWAAPRALHAAPSAGPVGRRVATAPWASARLRGLPPAQLRAPGGGARRVTLSSLSSSVLLCHAPSAAAATARTGQRSWRVPGSLMSSRKRHRPDAKRETHTWPRPPLGTEPGSRGVSGVRRAGVSWEV